MTLEISPDEHRQRQNAMRRWLAETRLTGAVIFDPASIGYYTGFFFAPTERPLVLIMPLDAEPLLLVPQVEQERAAACTTVGDVRVYREYPGRVHPMLTLVDVLQERGLATAAIGVDYDGWPPVFGYRGPTLSQLTDPALLASIRELVLDQRMVKSAAEIDCLREGARWAVEGLNALVRLLGAATSEALSTLDLALQASAEASAAMLRAHGPRYTLRRPDQSLPVVVRLAVGSESARSGELPGQARLQADTVAIIGATADVGGYVAQVERTIFLGKPDDRAVGYFAGMLELGAAGVRGVRAGRRAREVAAEVDDLARHLGVLTHLRHRCGHGLGLEPHERPFLDVGDATQIAAGMVLALTPGLYVPGLGGFRHTDTVVVGDEEPEVITEFPRDMETLTLRP